MAPAVLTIHLFNRRLCFFAVADVFPRRDIGLRYFRCAQLHFSTPGDTNSRNIVNYCLNQQQHVFINIKNNTPFSEKLHLIKIQKLALYTDL